MAGRSNHVAQIAAMTRVIEVTPQASAFRAHVQSIIESQSFKGSRRSQEFLRFIVERALDRQFDDLKERALGVELFGRSPTYDTGDDAIVRVTACEVRKRLAQYYAEVGQPSELRVDLPTGSYLPEFRNVTPEVMKAPVVPDEPPVADVEPVCRPAVKAVVTPANRWKRLAWATAATLAAIAISSSVFWWWSARRSVQAASSSRTLPWSALRQTNRQIHLVFCDPEIVTVQRLLNYSVSLSDYANQRYWPSDMTPDARQIMQAITFRGVSVAAVDANIALKIDHLIAPLQHPLLTHTARGLRLGDFKTEDSFILFGSPRSNPWVELFQDQLDFRFEFDSNRRAEFVRNRRPAQGESQVYTPTAEGWGTGNAYAIIALIGNPDQSGQVLLLAGSNAEATEAAGSLASNAEAMAKVLRAHGIEPGGRSRHFEILLRVSTMAGMPNTFEVMACHALGPAS